MSINLKSGLILVGMIGLTLMLLPGCNELTEWRDSQIKTSHEIGEGTKITIPEPPITIPGKLYGELPLEAGFTVLSYNTSKKDISLVVLMDKDLNDASMWLLTKLAGLGYGSADNASRILEGTTYSPASPSAKYSAIYVKLEYGDSGRSILHINAAAS